MFAVVGKNEDNVLVVERMGDVGFGGIRSQINRLQAYAY